ncbi:MAG: N-acetylmuramoyl-L-alanine amidase [Ardenticatenaceae bacterium]|nr:N-acetylmuramoyl-L-alanine amidase [Ardenticatenaceae bacterium]
MESPSPFDSPPILDTLRRNIAIFLFFLIAGAGMLTIYAYFIPTGEASAEAAAIIGNGQTLSAAITKPIPGRQAQQRFAQTEAPLQIAIIVGHRGSDSGAVCDDGLTELEINTEISDLVVSKLEEQGLSATLLDEFDVRLNNFDGTMMISIHADSCIDFGSSVTGYKVAGSSITDSTQLVTCMEQAYGSVTGLSIHPNTITTHMTDYHAFRLLAPGTPAIILETGFMYQDRSLLTQQPELPAQGVVDGILCFLNQ